MWIHLCRCVLWSGQIPDLLRCKGLADRKMGRRVFLMQSQSSWSLPWRTQLILLLACHLQVDLHFAGHPGPSQAVTAGTGSDCLQLLRPARSEEQRCCCGLRGRSEAALQRRQGTSGWCQSRIHLLHACLCSHGNPGTARQFRGKYSHPIHSAALLFPAPYLLLDRIFTCASGNSAQRISKAHKPVLLTFHNRYHWQHFHIHVGFVLDSKSPSNMTYFFARKGLLLQLANECFAY